MLRTELKINTVNRVILLEDLEAGSYFYSGSTLMRKLVSCDTNIEVTEDHVMIEEVRTGSVYSYSPKTEVELVEKVSIKVE